MRPDGDFFNLYNHQLIRVGVAIPAVRVADPAFNARQVSSLVGEAVERRAIAVLFPELSLSAYSCDDLFHQTALLDACESALRDVVEASRAWPLVAVVGVPLVVDHLLYNCAVIVCRGRILGVVPKTYLPNYREFYERRQFTPADAAIRDTLDCCGQRDVPFGPDLLFTLEEQPRATFHVEICEDLWVPVPPSSYAALAGATVLLNLSASNVTVAKADYRHLLVAGQSARCLAAYLYSGAGPGESTTDLAWDGHALIYENGELLAESRRFSYDPQLVYGEIDLERLAQERMRQGTFGQSAERHRTALRAFRRVLVPLSLPRRGDSSPSVAMRVIPTCPRTASAVTPAARKFTRFRSRGSSSGCNSPVSREWSSGCQEGSIPRMHCSCAPAPWRCWAIRAATSSAIRCRASPRAGARSSKPVG